MPNERAVRLSRAHHVLRRQPGRGYVFSSSSKSEHLYRCVSVWMYVCWGYRHTEGIGKVYQNNTQPKPPRSLPPCGAGTRTYVWVLHAPGGGKLFWKLLVVAGCWQRTFLLNNGLALPLCPCSRGTQPAMVLLFRFHNSYPQTIITIVMHFS